MKGGEGKRKGRTSEGKRKEQKRSEHTQDITSWSWS